MLEKQQKEPRPVKAAPDALRTMVTPRRVQRLNQLLERYRHALAVQQALLNLSELASSLSDMSEFYPRIQALINTYLAADNFYVVLVDPTTDQYELAFFADEKDHIELADVQAADFAIGLTGYVVRSGQSLLCDEPTFNQLLAENAIQSKGSPCHHWLGVPLRRGSSVLGVMVVQLYDSRRDYGPRDVSLLETVAAHTVTAIDRVKSRELLEQTVRERTQQLETINQSLQKEIHERQQAEKLQAALYKIAELTVDQVDMVTFYPQIHQVLAELLPAENCYIALLDDVGKRLSFPFYRDQFTPHQTDRVVGHGFTEYILRVGEARLIDRVMAEQLIQRGEVSPRVNPQGTAKQPLAVSWLGVPLRIDQQALGVIALQSYDNRYTYTQTDLELLQFVSRYIAVAIQRKLVHERQRQHQEELERRIFERTRELRQTNLFLRLQVEERKKAEEKLFHEANHDVLTGLANRQMFMLQLRQRFAMRSRQPDLRFSLLFIDLDRFKLINDTMGHHTGDAFLTEISRRLQQTVRELDLVARLGGDEFVVMLGLVPPETDAEAIAEDVAERIIDAVRQPMELQGQLVYSGASIGIAHYRPDYPNADALLRDADAAMYQAKALGRSRYVIFNDAMRQQLLDDMSFEQALHLALEDQQFGIRQRAIHQPPQRQPVGFHAELCWQHPSQGCQLEFCQQAAQAGLLVQIELQVLHQQLQRLQQPDHHGILLLPLSTQLLTNPVHTSKFIRLLNQAPEALTHLVVCFRETELLKVNQQQLGALHSLHKAGVRLGLMQFGSEFMPLGLLTQYPFEYVTLEAGFCRNLLSQPSKRALMELLLGLSETYHFTLIADGLDAEQSHTLQSLGCYYLGEEVPSYRASDKETSRTSSVFLQHLA